MFHFNLKVDGFVVYQNGFEANYLSDFTTFFKDMLANLKNDINVNVIFAHENKKSKLTFSRVTKRKIKQLTSSYNYFDQKNIEMIKEKNKYDEQKCREELDKYKEKALIFTSYFNGNELYKYEMNMNKRNFAIEKLYCDQFIEIVENFTFELEQRLIADHVKREFENYQVYLEWTEDLNKTLLRINNLEKEQGGFTREYLIDKVNKNQFTPQLKNKFYQVSEAILNPEKITLANK